MSKRCCQTPLIRLWDGWARGESRHKNGTRVTRCGMRKRRRLVTTQRHVSYVEQRDTSSRKVAERKNRSRETLPPDLNKITILFVSHPNFPQGHVLCERRPFSSRPIFATNTVACPWRSLPFVWVARLALFVRDLDLASSLPPAAAFVDTDGLLLDSTGVSHSPHHQDGSPRRRLPAEL